MVLLKISDASKFLGLSPDTVRKYIDNDVISGIRIGHYRYVEKEELIRFQKEGTDQRKYGIDLKLSDQLQCPECPALCGSMAQLSGHFSQNHIGLKLKDFMNKIKIVPKKDIKSKSETESKMGVGAFE